MWPLWRLRIPILSPQGFGLDRLAEIDPRYESDQRSSDNEI
jgi:hypothetical protein